MFVCVGGVDFTVGAFATDLFSLWCLWENYVSHAPTARFSFTKFYLDRGYSV